MSGKGVLMRIKVNLEDVLAKRRMSKLELANRMHTSEEQIRMLEKIHFYDTRLEIIELICSELNIDPSEIIEYKREQVYEFEF